LTSVLQVKVHDLPKTSILIFFVGTFYLEDRYVRRFCV
jgi:hypothetical protein